jgi:hypothetical protein
MDVVIPDLSYLRDGTAVLVGSARLYRQRRHDDIQPLLTGFSVEQLWDAQCLLIVSLCSLDDPDLDLLAARVRVVAARLTEHDPAVDDVMSQTSQTVSAAFAQARPLDGGIDIPTPGAAVSAVNLYPWIIAFCLMTHIAAFVWVPADAGDGEVGKVIEEAADAANELVDLAEADALAAATDAIDPASAKEREVAVMRLALLMLTGRLVDPGVRQAFMVGKEPVQVGPYVLEAMLIATVGTRLRSGAPDPWASPDLEGLRAAARELVTSPHPDAQLQNKVVSVLADAITKTTAVSDAVYTPMTRFDPDVTADDLLAALAHVGDVIVEVVYPEPVVYREILVSALEQAVAGATG